MNVWHAAAVRDIPELVYNYSAVYNTAQPGNREDIRFRLGSHKLINLYIIMLFTTTCSLIRSNYKGAAAGYSLYPKAAAYFPGSRPHGCGRSHARAPQII